MDGLWSGVTADEIKADLESDGSSDLLEVLGLPE